MAHGGMGYAQEYHVERYMRECFVPRIAPVSRVSNKYSHPIEELLADAMQEMILNYIGEKVLGLPRSY